MIFVKTILLSIIILQAACTSVVWNGGIYDADRAIDTQTITTQTTHDHIYAFGQMPIHEHRPLSGSLVMMGQKYWYAMQSDTSQSMLKALLLGLPKRYQITAPYSGKRLNRLPITVIDGRYFSSEFCLDYVAENGVEQDKLLRLQFQVQANSRHFRQCYAIAGKLYHKPSQFQTHHHFHKYMPIELTIKQNTTHIQPNKLARNVLLTPFALAVDTVSGMVMLPILLIGDLF